MVKGQSNVIPATTNSALRCTIDGVEVGSDVVSASNLRYWNLCHGPSLSPGQHNVVVNITAGPNTVFWVDEIYYGSLFNPNLRRKYSMLYPNTLEFQYTGISWMSPFDEKGMSGRETYAQGAKVIMPFYGMCSYLHSPQSDFYIYRRLVGGDCLSNVANATGCWFWIILS